MRTAKELLAKINPLPNDGGKGGEALQLAELHLKYSVNEGNAASQLYWINQANQEMQVACESDPMYCPNNYDSGSGTPASLPDGGGLPGQAVAAGAVNWDPNFRGKLSGAGDPAAPMDAPTGAAASQRASPETAAREAGREDILSKPVANISGRTSVASADVSAASAEGQGARSSQQQAYAFLRSAANKLSLSDNVGALQDALHAIDLDLRNPAGYLRAAEAYNHMGQFADAEKMAREAIARDLNNAQAWKNLAWALLKEGKYADALQAALRAVQLKPDMAEAWAIASYAVEKLGDMKARLAYIEKAAAQDPRFQEKLDMARSDGKIYSDDDKDSLFGDMAARVGKTKVPLVALGAAAALLVLVSGAWLWRRQREIAAPKKTVVMLHPPTPAVARAPQLVAPSGAGVVIGKYELGAVIGRGGMGEVFEATDLSLGRKVAIKKMTEGFSEFGSQARALFLKEARTVAQLHHPAIVDIYEILDHQGALYLVFEYVKGKTAQQLLAELGRLPLRRTADILEPVCQALDFAHSRSLVHRDLKPGNIMLTEQGHVKLMDFGIARSLADAGLRAPTLAAAAPTAAALFSRTVTVVGTPDYMAPESETGVVCKEGDVYSLGVSCYELLTGRLPFSAKGMALEKATLAFERATAIVRELPAAVDDLIARALQPTQAARLKTPGEFFKLLSTAARGWP